MVSFSTMFSGKKIRIKTLFIKEDANSGGQRFSPYHYVNADIPG